jgi:hypothetical protein
MERNLKIKPGFLLLHNVFNNHNAIRCVCILHTPLTILLLGKKFHLSLAEDTHSPQARVPRIKKWSPILSINSHHFVSPAESDYSRKVQCALFSSSVKGYGEPNSNASFNVNVSEVIVFGVMAPVSEKRLDRFFPCSCRSHRACASTDVRHHPPASHN